MVRSGRSHGQRQLLCAHGQVADPLWPPEPGGQHLRLEEPGGVYCLVVIAGCAPSLLTIPLTHPGILETSDVQQGGLSSWELDRENRAFGGGESSPQDGLWPPYQRQPSHQLSQKAPGSQQNSLEALLRDPHSRKWESPHPCSGQWLHQPLWQGQS